MIIWVISVLIFVCATTSIAIAELHGEKALRASIRSDKMLKSDTENSIRKLKIPFLSPTDIGTGQYLMGVSEATCIGLALLNGQYSIVKSLEKQLPGKIPPHPWKGEQVRFSVGFGLFTLGNIIATKEGLLELPVSSRAKKWNLNCVGKFGIPETEIVPVQQPMASIEVDGDSIVVLGDVVEGFFGTFKAAVEAHDSLSEVRLGSGGGSVLDAILIGKLIRQRKLSTTLLDDCYSACPLAFLGGVDRIVIMAAFTRLGFHQLSKDGHALPDDHPAYHLIREYVDEMGADGRFVIDQMKSSPPDKMSYPSVWELCDPNVTTWVRHGCSGAQRPLIDDPAEGGDPVKFKGP